MPRSRTAFRPQVDGLESRVALSTAAPVHVADRVLHLDGTVKGRLDVTVRGDSFSEVLIGSGRLSPIGRVTILLHKNDFSGPQGGKYALVVRDSPPDRFPFFDGEMFVLLRPHAFGQAHHTSTYRIEGGRDSLAGATGTGHYTLDLKFRSSQGPGPNGYSEIYDATIAFSP